MDAKTLKALNGSISKWKKIVAGTGSDKGTNNCPLCHLFFGRCACEGCPAAMHGIGGCFDTPYMDWLEATDDQKGKATNSIQRRAARNELKFLRSLLPKKKGKR